MKGKLPLALTLRLDPEDAELVRRLVRTRGNRSLQSTVVGVLREFEERYSVADRAAEDLAYKVRYFELAETTEDLRKQTAKLLAKLDHAQAMAAGLKPAKIDKKKRRK